MPTEAGGVPELSWGRWNTADFRRFREQVFVAQPGGQAETTAFMWVPHSMADLSGTVTYVNNAQAAGGILDEQGLSTAQKLDVRFTVDFGTAAISNGVLGLTERDGSFWDAQFVGAVRGYTATMQLLDSSQLHAVGAPAPVSGDLGGVFVGTGNTPDFVMGFVLQSAVDSVQGIVQVTPATAE